MGKDNFVYVIRDGNRLLRVTAERQYDSEELKRFISKRKVTSKKKLYPLAELLVKKQIIRYLRPVAFENESAIYGFTTKIYSETVDENAGGFSLDKKIAYKRCLGEAMERFALISLGRKDTEPISYDELEGLGHLAVEPSKFVLFRDQDYKNGTYVPFLYDTKVCWVKGIRLSDEKEILLPAQAVYLSYKKSPDEEKVEYTSSTGSSCHRNKNDAIRRGLLEVLERDALMRMWLLKEVPARIDLSKIDGVDTKIYLSFFASRGIEVHSYLIRSEFKVPIVFCIGLKKDGPLYFYLGSACELNLKDAVRHSLDELVQSQTINSMTKDQLRHYKNLTYSEFRDVDHRISLLLNKRYVRENFRFIIESRNEPTEQDYDLSIDFRCLLSNLKSLDFEPIWIDITPEEILDLGFYVVKVVVPGIQPLDVVHSYKHLGPNSRVFGLSNVVNSAPHPFY